VSFDVSLIQKNMKKYISIVIVVFITLGILWSAPSTAKMKELGRQAATGDKTAIDKIEEIRVELYEGINYETDRERVIKNLNLMTSAFDVIAKEVKDPSDSDPAFQSLKYATGIDRLAGFTANAFGIAAANGHKPSLDVLLHYPQYGLLLSSVVFALNKPASKGNEEAIDFLVDVINNEKHKPLWRGASQGLVMASNSGNAKAKAALVKYEEYEKDRSKKQS
jgi:hypothetical protein